jgi:hypothetical protein
LDNCFDFLKNEYNIELKTYGNLIRIALNYIQTDSLLILRERLSINTELEVALINEGGYEIEFLGTNNPKTILLKLIEHLSLHSRKLNVLKQLVKKKQQRKIIVADLNDIPFLTSQLQDFRCKIVTLSELKKGSEPGSVLYFYSFNGKKDFDFISSLPYQVELIVYEQESQLFAKQTQKRKLLIEQEINSNDRFIISDVQYIAEIEEPIVVSKVVERTVKQLDDYTKRMYENYKDETDALLDDIEEKTFYKIFFENNKSNYLESNETVFNEHGELVKVYRLKANDKIRIYPREHFAEKLFQVAIETDPDGFGNVDHHSKSWLLVLEKLKNIHKSNLHSKLKEKGLRVLPNTVDGYFTGQSKFPMFNSDLKAIYRLEHDDLEDSEINLILAPIRKSKSIYNSTMIALGRGMKQEMKYYLKENRIGSILNKLGFSDTTLNIFLNQYMPVQQVTKRELVNDLVFNKTNDLI